MPFWQQFYNLFHSFYIIECSFFGIKGLWEGSSTVSDTVLAFIEFDEAQKVGVGTGPLDAQHLRPCNKILFNVHVINRWRGTGDGNPGE